MHIHIHLHDHRSGDMDKLFGKIDFLTEKVNAIFMTQEELAQGLTAVSAQVAKIGEESKVTLQKVTDLEAALANQTGVTPEVQTAFDALKTQVQVVDDLVIDTPTTTP